MKKMFGKKESVSKQGRKKDKPEPTLEDGTFDCLDVDLDVDHVIEYMDTEEPMNKGRLSEETDELKLTTDTEEISQDNGSGEKGGNAKELVSSARPEDSTVRPDVGTADPIAPPLTTITRKGVLEEPVPGWKGKKEKRQREEEASKDVIAEMYDEVQVGIEANALFATKLQQEEREEYTIEEREKFSAKTIASQRRFRAAQRFAEIRSRPPTKSKPRNFMMTYLKNMGGYKYS
nr:hypothetical protein [Tanacetum cinerariifolium]